MMKNLSKISFILIMIVTTMVGMVVIPYIVKMMTYKPYTYPFIYYSPILKELCMIDNSDKQYPMTDKSGNRYSVAQSDTLQPFFNYRQLISDGRMKDTVCGIPVTMQLLTSKSVVFRYNPSSQSTHTHGLNMMFESMPIRLGLELPEDVFCISDDIVFIDSKTNTVNSSKSRIFHDAMVKAGYKFPAQWVIGNNNIRKKYDEGFFSKDDAGELYHVKMVNGRPYVRNTHISDTIDVEFFHMTEVADRRMYGFAFGRDSSVHIVCNTDGMYYCQKLDIDKFDWRNTSLMLIGDILYWNITMKNDNGITTYALNTDDLTRVDELSLPRVDNDWDRVSSLLFPYYVEVSHDNSEYVYPRIVTTQSRAWIFNIVLAVLSVVGFRKREGNKLLLGVIVALTGIPGLLAYMILPVRQIQKT